MSGASARGDLAEVEQPRQPGHEQDAPDHQGAQADDFLFVCHGFLAQQEFLVGAGFKPAPTPANPWPTA